MKLNLDINRIIENVISLGAVGAIAILGFYIAQNYFSFFSYQGMSRKDVMNTVKKVEAQYPLLSRACGDGFCRGIYLTNSGLLYYRLEDRNGHTSYQLYQVPSELFTTEKSVLPQNMIGKYVSK